MAGLVARPLSLVGSVENIAKKRQTSWREEYSVLQGRDRQVAAKIA
jgi:hypothetical protein